MNDKYTKLVETLPKESQDLWFEYNLEVNKILQENQELKQKLNWIAFGDDAELALRYLRKIGYVDFDEERKVYINKHNNEPFALDEEEEKTYYIKSEELNEYTKQLEYQNKELKKQLDELNRFKFSCKKDETQIPSTVYNKKIIEDISKIKTQQQEFIKYLEDEIQNKRKKSTTLTAFIRNVVPLQQCLQKYKEIIGDIKNEN